MQDVYIRHRLFQKAGPIPDTVEEVSDVHKIDRVRLVEPIVFRIVDLEYEIWGDPLMSYLA